MQHYHGVQSAASASEPDDVKKKLGTLKRLEISKKVAEGERKDTKSMYPKISFRLSRFLKASRV